MRMRDLIRGPFLGEMEVLALKADYFKDLASDYYNLLIATARERTDSAARARAALAVKRNGDANWNRVEWRAIASRALHTDLNQTRRAVAADIRAELARRRGTKAKLPAIRTIEDAIKNVRKAVIQDLARTSKRTAR